MSKPQCNAGQDDENEEAFQRELAAAIAASKAEKEPVFRLSVYFTSFCQSVQSIGHCVHVYVAAGWRGAVTRLKGDEHLDIFFLEIISLSVVCKSSSRSLTFV